MLVYRSVRAGDAEKYLARLDDRLAHHPRLNDASGEGDDIRFVLVLFKHILKGALTVVGTLGKLTLSYSEYIVSRVDACLKLTASLGENVFFKCLTHFSAP